MPGDSKKLPPPLSSFGKSDEQQKAALAAYGEQLGATDFGTLDDAPELEEEPPAPEAGSDSSKRADEPDDPHEAEAGVPSFIDTALSTELTAELTGPANLEPVGDEAHPPQNRRLPTQPPQALALELDDEPRKLSARTRDEAAASAKPDSSPATQPRPAGAAYPISSRQSPAPRRRGLFAVDRVTNWLVGGAVGLLVTIVPAKKMAESYETQEVRPLIAELERSVERPLGVEAGVVEAPESIAARIDAGRSKTRRRYALIWLLCGLPIAVALGLASRP